MAGSGDMKPGKIARFINHYYRIRCGLGSAGKHPTREDGKMGKNKVTLPGFLAWMFLEENWESVEENNEEGNRTWSFNCGCFFSSGAGAYGSKGSAVAADKCYRHED